MDDDDDDKEKATQPKDESEITEYEEPSSDSLSSSLLSKVKKELPSKIKNLQENK